MRSIQSMTVQAMLATYVAGIYGLLVDWVLQAEAKGARIVQGTGGREYVIVDGVAYPVLCGAIVPRVTEDGPTDGRCGQRATVDGACAFHAAEADEWARLTERERRGIERMEDERDFGRDW